MRIHLVKNYMLEVSHDELLLISKALRGQLRPDKGEVDAAKQLDLDLGHQRVQISEILNREVAPIKKALDP